MSLSLSGYVFTTGKDHWDVAEAVLYCWALLTAIFILIDFWVCLNTCYHLDEIVVL